MGNSAGPKAVAAAKAYGGGVDRGTVCVLPTPEHPQALTEGLHRLHEESPMETQER